METKTIWYAMGADGFGRLTYHKPERNEEEKIWMFDKDVEHISINCTRYFPPLTWEDEPIEIEIKQV